MQTLCNRCICALRSRGETVLVGYEVADSTADTCSWCEQERDDTDLFMVMVNPFGNVCGELGEGVKIYL